MIEKDDWRLSFGQEMYVKNSKMKYVTNYQQPSKEWDHEHCDFCTLKISGYEGDLHAAYCTLDEKWWACENCFNDFKKMFGWELMNPEDV